MKRYDLGYLRQMNSVPHTAMAPLKSFPGRYPTRLYIELRIEMPSRGYRSQLIYRYHGKYCWAAIKKAKKISKSLKGQAIETLVEYHREGVVYFGSLTAGSYYRSHGQLYLDSPVTSNDRTQWRGGSEIHECVPQKIGHTVYMIPREILNQVKTFDQWKSLCRLVRKQTEERRLGSL